MSSASAVSIRIFDLQSFYHYGILFPAAQRLNNASQTARAEPPPTAALARSPLIPDTKPVRSAARMLRCINAFLPQTSQVSPKGSSMPTELLWDGKYNA